MGRSQVLAKPPVVVVTKRVSFIHLPGATPLLLLCILETFKFCSLSLRWPLYHLANTVFVVNRFHKCFEGLSQFCMLSAFYGLWGRGAGMGSGCTAASHTRHTCFWILAFNHSCCSGENGDDGDEDHYDSDVMMLAMVG